MKSLSLSFLLLILGSGLCAQTTLRNFESTATMGIGETYVERLSQDENLDFLNYVDGEPIYFDFVTIKLGFKFDFMKNLHVDINLITMSDLMPDKFNIFIDYRLNKAISLGVGSNLHTLYITYYEEYHQQANPDYYVMDGNIRQLRTWDLGIYLSSGFRLINTERFKALVKCNLGLATFLKEEASFYLKKEYSNEKRLYDYHTRIAFQPYINPEVNLKLRVFKIKESSFGIVCNSNFFFSKRSMNYDRSIQVWTSDNAINEKIKPPKHIFIRSEIEFGLYFEW